LFVQLFAAVIFLIIKAGFLFTQTDRILIENQRKYLFDNNVLPFVTYKEQEVKKTNSLLLKTFSS